MESDYFDEHQLGKITAYGLPFHDQLHQNSVSAFWIYLLLFSWQNMAADYIIMINK